RQLKASLSAANVSQWTDALPFVLLGIRNAVNADIGYTAAQLVYGSTLRLPGEFVDPSSSSMSMDLTSYTNRLTNAMRSVKPASTRPQSTDVFVQPDLRYSRHVFVRRDSNRRPFESAYEGPFKVLQREPKYYIIDKNGTNDSISIDRLKAAYLEGNPIYVDFPSVKLNDTTPTLIIPHPTTNTHDDTSTVAENKLKTTRSGRRWTHLAEGARSCIRTRSRAVTLCSTSTAITSQIRSEIPDMLVIAKYTLPISSTLSFDFSWWEQSILEGVTGRSVVKH
ncbi:unnamed protein product, partial [Schistosoma margrebowiei]